MSKEEAISQWSQEAFTRERVERDESVALNDPEPSRAGSNQAIFSRRVLLRQLGSFWQSRALKSLPELTRALLIALLTTYTLTWYEPFREFFSFSPAQTLSGLRIWNIVTYGFVEEHLLHLLVSATVLIVVGRLLEDIWHHPETSHSSAERTLELAMYLLFVTAFSSVMTFVVSFLAFMTLKLHPDYLFTSCSGFYAGNLALLIAFARYRPDYVFPELGVLARYAPARMLPLAYLNTIVSLVPLEPALWLPACISSFAFLGSWGYFRFAKTLQLPMPEVAGAPAEFSLLLLLPEIVERVLKRIGFLPATSAPSSVALLDVQANASARDADRRRSTATHLLEGHLRVGNTNLEPDVASNV
ncbi:hypothetical protein CCYA_CCYA07G2055 [Cyanidiococcus yangmingshanensis]|nr:hypothetical protein CCYA_CCYA07G2055 [Cyanidiococcus yangmingshanensis]